jgi:hypothetical protein
MAASLGLANLPTTQTEALPWLARGNWLWGNNHPETSEPGLFLLSGRFVLSVDALGNESFRSVGRFIDLCAELAA